MSAPLVLTPGDPLGVGPEVAAKALWRRWRDGTLPEVVVAGDTEAFARWAERLGLPLDAIGLQDTGGAEEPTEVAAVRWAVSQQLCGASSALVTGPIHKHRLSRQGFGFSGHTDFLGHLTGAEPVMAFAGGSLRVALVTVHVPLRAVAERLTTAGVLHVLRVSDASLRDQLGLAQRRLVVCGLNPHAGDGGLLGHEEDEIIAPAVAQAQAEGIGAVGPVSAEAAFRMAGAGRAELVVAMYHDQGLAPLKLVDFGRSVNWTLGLPIIRTSVDHGTADDIAGQGIAEAESMGAALAFAERLAVR